jgi:hypothetical protein
VGALWDVYVIDGDPFLHVYVALALLILNRDVRFTALTPRTP